MTWNVEIAIYYRYVLNYEILYAVDVFQREETLIASLKTSVMIFVLYLYL